MEQRLEPLLDRGNATGDHEVRDEQTARFRRMDELIRQAGDRYRNYKFSTWTSANEAQSRIKEAVQEWAETFPTRLKQRESLVLYGPVGTGKDHLAFAASRQALLQHGAKVSWRNGRDLMGEVRDRIGDGSNEQGFLASLTRPQLLVVSDPLPVRGELTPHQADMLYRIVENRYAAGKLTCVTMNVADDAEADERLGAATWDRLCDGAWKCRCNWASHRQPARIVAP